MTARALRLLAALALATVTAVAAIGCGPASSSPNCPPGQWYVDKPGTGWICAPDQPFVYTPGYTFAPSHPAGSTS